MLPNAMPSHVFDPKWAARNFRRTDSGSLDRPRVPVRLLQPGQVVAAALLHFDSRTDASALSELCSAVRRLSGGCPGPTTPDGCGAPMTGRSEFGGSSPHQRPTPISSPLNPRPPSIKKGDVISFLLYTHIIDPVFTEGTSTDP